MTDVGEGLFGQLLNSLGKGRGGYTQLGESEQVQDYPWDRPQRFTGSQIARIEEFVGGFAESAVKYLAPQLHLTLQAGAAVTSQRFAPALKQELEGVEEFRCALVDDASRPLGLFRLPMSEACGWVERLLGGMQSDSEQQRDLSELERAILVDLVGELCRRLSGLLAEQDAPAVHAHQTAGSELLALDDDASIDYTTFMLPLTIEAGAEAEEEKKQVELRLVLRSSFLAEAFHCTPQASELDDSQLRMREHLHEARVQADIHLGSTRTPVRDLLSLEAGDVLVLDRRVDEPAELKIRGRALFQGSAVQCGEDYGFSVLTVAKQRDGNS
jgi:flagellar motor switch protein FliM